MSQPETVRTPASESLPAPQRIERAAREWQQTCDAIPSPILLLGRDGSIQRLNRAARDLLGQPWEACLGATLGSLAAGPPLADAVPIVEAVAAGAGTTRATVQDTAGERTWEIDAVPLPGEGDDGRRIVLQAFDRSETARLEARLRHSETMAALGMVVGGVAHEVRNPLFGMSAVLDAYDRRFPDVDPAQRRYLDLLRRELDRMTALMHALVDYSRPGVLSLGRCDLVTLLASAVAAVQPLARQGEVTLDVHGVDAGPQPVECDAERLLRTLGHVLENAVQFTPAGGAVRVAIGRDPDEDGMVRIAVDDEGPGFATEDLPRLGEPFYSRRPGGFGLGLPIVLRTVREHRGTVRLSNLPERGAHVELRLPRLSP